MYGLFETIQSGRRLQQSELDSCPVRETNATDVRLCPQVPPLQMTDRPEPGVAPDLLERDEEKVEEPPMYLVVLHNDDYTTMDFVVEVLVKIFQKNLISAMKIMLDVHRKGRGEVGRYTRDIAETKVTTVRRMAQEREFPLKCTMEPV